ncbi:hypothetical protein ACWCXE_21050 [Streptomyces sp. NPDC001780]
MNNGDKLRLRGPHGAPFMVTVGTAFTADYITAQLRTGEWSRIDDDTPAPEAPAQDPAGGKGQAPAEPPSPAAPAAPQGKAEGPDRPAAGAPKADWVAYVARTQHMSREDAANYTKADLIDMVS